MRQSMLLYQGKSKNLTYSRTRYKKYLQSLKSELQHGRDLETWHLEAGRHLGTSEADMEVGVLWTLDLEVVDF